MVTAVTAFVTVVCGLFGLVVGSFLNVVIYRVPRKESVVRPRSRCPGCGTQLAERDNIPVV
ncbi:MAG: prepilin peptidase, partial [Actinobacteria bacterium]